MTLFPDDTVKSSLTALFADAGFRPSRRRGQNFLIDTNMLLWIVREAALEKSDLVLEIGCGPGTLTRFLAEAAGHVIAVELDKNLFRIASTWIAGIQNVELLNCDALDGHHRLNPQIQKQTFDRLASPDLRRLKVVSNLPYSIATTTIAALLTGPLPIHSMLLTVQKEVAERLTAPVGAKQYGALSVLVRVTSTVRSLRRLPPDVFWPRPKVHSATIEIKPDASRRDEVADLRFLERLTKGMFSHRRKTTANALRSWLRDAGLDCDHFELMDTCGIRADDRCELITPEQFVKLSNLLLERGKDAVKS